jgi:acyl-CoA reductase-like NAD-dependent aldehyde dehydrogenase
VSATEAAIKTYKNLVGGELVDGVDGATRDVLNPATGAVIARVPEGGLPDVERAVAAARSPGATRRRASARSGCWRWRRSSTSTPASWPRWSR